MESFSESWPDLLRHRHWMLKEEDQRRIEALEEEIVRKKTNKEGRNAFLLLLRQKQLPQSMQCIQMRGARWDDVRKDGEGSTALMIAVDNCHFSIIDEILSQR